MTPMLQILGFLLLAGGLFFFTTGAIGLIRFPDTYTRLHAVTKADNVGLGLLVAGLAAWTGSVHGLLIMLLIWLFVMVSGATSCQLLARYQREHERQHPASEEDHGG